MHVFNSNSMIVCVVTHTNSFSTVLRFVLNVTISDGRRFEKRPISFFIVFIFVVKLWSVRIRYGSIRSRTEAFSFSSLSWLKWKYRQNVKTGVHKHVEINKNPLKIPCSRRWNIFVWIVGHESDSWLLSHRRQRYTKKSHLKSTNPAIENAVVVSFQTHHVRLRFLQYEILHFEMGKFHLLYLRMSEAVKYNAPQIHSNH